MNIGILYSRVRVEEKLLFEEFARRGIDFARLDDRELIFEWGREPERYDVVLERCINHSRALFALKLLNDAGVATVNKKRYKLGAGTLLLIEKGDEHEICNTGRGMLRTINFSVPPASTHEGDELPRDKR